jgi:hypothetical protein
LCLRTGSFGDGRQPDGTNTEFLKVIQLFANAVERSALKSPVLPIEGQVTGRNHGIIEPVEEQKVDGYVAPIGRRSKWCGYGNGAAANDDIFLLRDCGIF